MKKKLYIAPVMYTFRIAAAPLLLNGSITEDGNNAKTDTDGDEYDGNDWGSRRHDVWADDELDGKR